MDADNQTKNDKICQFSRGFESAALNIAKSDEFWPKALPATKVLYLSFDKFLLAVESHDLC